MCDILSNELPLPADCRITIVLCGPELTMPILSAHSEVWFSAYCFGWGYRAFSLSREAVSEILGPAPETPEQLTRAFELGKRRILRAVERSSAPAPGERITLHGADFRDSASVDAAYQ
jgi:hypothetical protein